MSEETERGFRIRIARGELLGKVEEAQDSVKMKKIALGSAQDNLRRAEKDLEFRQEELEAFDKRHAI